MRGNKWMRWIVLCVVVALSVMATLSAHANEKEQKVVRVGFYESAFHRTDKFGRVSGYGYEYQQRVATYAGWKYEYVEGSWSQLLEKLMAGEIDLLSDVSYTPKRAEKILYSAEPMGSEGYHVFIAPNNTEIKPDDFSTFNGKRLGVNKNSIQAQLFRTWAEKHDVHPEIIELSVKTPKMLEMLAKGEIDMLVTLDTYGYSADIVPVCKIGFAESFFGVNKNRPDIKQDLDAAMNRLFEENRDFNQEMTARFHKASAVNRFLSTEEREWLSRHGVIRVGYKNNFLPFCTMDEGRKTLTGALADYLAFADNAEKNAKLNFETRPFESTEDALQALEKGEIDCVFPVNLSTFDAEKRNIVITTPLISTMIYAGMRSDDTRGVSRDREMTVAIVRGNSGNHTFLMDHFPKWKAAIYPDGPSGYQAVADGKADCMLLNNYRLNRESERLAKYKLMALVTGQAMDMSFAVRQKDDCLYSILNKINHIYPRATLNSSLTKYALKDTKVTFGEFLRDNMALVIAAAAIIAALFMWLQLRKMRAEEKAEEGQQIISETERDPLTGLYNWNFFLAYVNRFFREHPDKPMDAVVMNIDRFHSVNTLHGRETGDSVLRALGEEIKRFLSETEGTSCRFEVDHFDIHCPHREDWQTQLKRFQNRMDDLFRNVNVTLRMGVQPWVKGMEPLQQFDRARTACNKTKGDYKDRVIIFDTNMVRLEEREQLLLNDLNRALEKRELEVFYQPKYYIQREQPELASAEALVRWNHPELGLVSPDEFIPLFERSGKIISLDHYVWEETARQMAAWQDKYGTVLPVSVNLSRVDVFDPALSSILDGIVEKNGLSCRNLKLEVTESAYTENAEQLIKVIEQLRGKGYEIEMDDFGSGYSSLNMLSSMPVDILKMDIAFIRNIERNEKDFRLVELIVDIARNLKVPVVAEGVETVGQMKLLKDAGCDIVQGYYFSRPLPAEEFEQKIFGLNEKKA